MSSSSAQNPFESPTTRPSETRRSSLKPPRSPGRRPSRVRFEDLSDLESLEAAEGGLYLQNKHYHSQIENDRVTHPLNHHAQRQSDSTSLNDGGSEAIAFITPKDQGPKKACSESSPPPVTDVSERKRRRLHWFFSTRKLESTPSQLSAQELDIMKRRERRGFLPDFYDILELPRPVEEIQVPQPSHRKDSEMTLATTSNRKDSAKTLVNADDRKDSTQSEPDSEAATRPVALKLANKKDAATVANEKIVFHQCCLSYLLSRREYTHPIF